MPATRHHPYLTYVKVTGHATFAPDCSSPYFAKTLDHGEL